MLRQQTTSTDCTTNANAVTNVVTITNANANDDDDDDDPNTRELLSIISREIKRNGGISRVNSLPQYTPHISKLLIHTSHSITACTNDEEGKNGKAGKPPRKLLSFLEDYPLLFQVNRQHNPHIVRLVSSTAAALLREEGFYGDDGDDDDGGCDGDAEAVQCAAKVLQQRTAYELQKRVSKLQRRLKKANTYLATSTTNTNTNTNTMNGDTHTAITTTPTTATEDEDEIPPATLQWLTSKVQNELHSYIRLLPERPVGVLPFSEEWFGMASSPYLVFLEERSRRTKSMDECGHVSFRTERLRCQGQDAALEQTKVYLISQSAAANNNNNDCTKTTPDVEHIATRIKLILHNSAPPIGGMDFGKLLQDDKLRALTRGMDVRLLIEENPIFFQHVKVFQDAKRRGCWYIAASISIDESSEEGQGQGQVKGGMKNDGRALLAADEVGTFSLTKPRLATAMAKLLFNACKNGHLTKCDDSDATSSSRLHEDSNAKEQKQSSRSFTCIDLTAGVGGNTISFGKIFSQVFAYEIDPARARFLEQNLDSFLGGTCSSGSNSHDRRKVIVECRDSMGALEGLASRLRPRPPDGDLREGNVNEDGLVSPVIAVFIDPPFGGIHYRCKKRPGVVDDTETDFESLNLGKDMPLTRVVALVSVHLSPVTIGLKLPLNFEVASFVENVKKEKDLKRADTSSVQVIIIKKIERQLFVILHVK